MIEICRIYRINIQLPPRKNAHMNYEWSVVIKTAKTKTKRMLRELSFYAVLMEF